MAKKAPAKPPSKRKPRPKKPVVPATPETLKAPAWSGMMKPVITAVIAALAAGGFCAAGIWSAGGIPIGPDVPSFNDCLSESHTADRASQVRILREYAGKTFASEPDAQSWLNAQRIEARKADFIPYTDELGAAADNGVDAVKALADKLEGKR